MIYLNIIGVCDVFGDTNSRFDPSITNRSSGHFDQTIDRAIDFKDIFFNL